MATSCSTFVDLTLTVITKALSLLFVRHRLAQCNCVGGRAFLSLDSDCCMWPAFISPHVFQTRGAVHLRKQNENQQSRGTGGFSDKVEQIKFRFILTISRQK